MQNRRNPFSYRKEIGSSSSSIRQPNDYKVGTTLTDPIIGDTYLLNKEIGSSSNGFCHVYRALYSKCLEENNSVLVPSGYVTLKIINKNYPECDELEQQIHTSISYTPHSNLIGLKRAFTTKELICISLPYMSKGSLRYILSTRPDKKLSEDFISVVLKEVLIGLRDELHVECNPRVHKTLNAGDIFVHHDDVTGEMLIKLAFEASVYDSENININLDFQEKLSFDEASEFFDLRSISKWGAAPEVFEGNISGLKSDIWLLGMTALELAYGDLPVRNREDLECIIKKIREKKKLPRSLEKLLIVKKKKKKKKKGIFKKAMDSVKGKKRVFSEEFEEIVLACLSENPDSRPTADQLLNIPFFTTAIERFEQFVLNGKNPNPTDNGAVEDQRILDIYYADTSKRKNVGIFSRFLD